MNGDSGWLKALTLVLLAALVGACTPVAPYRIALPDTSPPPDCTPQPGSDAAVPVVCQNSLREHTPSYDLLFVEFDDQGLQYPKEMSGVGEAPQQINRVMEYLKKLSQAEGGLTLIVFVHGWKHNARADDDNVREFRQALEAAAFMEQAAMEKASVAHHRIVGIYVSWRGLSVDLGPVANLSFWDRKFTAQYVAEGSARALFSRLKGFQCSQNTPPGKAGCDAPPSGARPKVSMILIGHSFGGLILYNAISQALVESLSYAADSGNPPAPAERFGDLVVLLNPAFEATRYTPLHRIATTRAYATYQAPIFVSVTSTADTATGTFFPLGRFLNTLLETTVSKEESTANKNTIGHVPLYITHKLGMNDAPRATCAGWKSLQGLDAAADRLAQTRANLVAEARNNVAFFAGKTALPANWVRPFCGGASLQHVQYDPNSPIWNVETDKDVMTGHGDISNPNLVNFLRQLFHDAILRPILTACQQGAQCALPPAR